MECSLLGTPGKQSVEGRGEAERVERGVAGLVVGGGTEWPAWGGGYLLSISEQEGAF